MSISAFNSRTTFFPDMWFKQNHKGHYSAWFKPQKITHFLQNQKKTILEVIRGIIPKTRFFPKNLVPSAFYLKGTLNSWEVMSYLWAVLEKTRLPTDILTVVKS